MDEYVNLAKNTVETFLKTNQIPPLPKDLPQAMLKKKAGAFVSIHQKNGELRGCIGTFLPTKPNLALEIITNAISSATQDPRFRPITQEKLDNLVYSVDILSPPKPATKKEINPKKYGLIVKSEDGRKGLLLPDLEGVDTPEQQIAICCQKAGIGPKEKISYQIFTVERHQENK
jgi:AmmeMemoRadiSam system protein A